MIWEWILLWKSSLPWFHDQMYFSTCFEWIGFIWGMKKRMQMEKKRISSVIWYWIISQFVFSTAVTLFWFHCHAMAWTWAWPKPSSPQDPVIYIIRSGAGVCFFLPHGFFCNSNVETLDMTSWNTDWFFFGILLLMADERFQNQKTGKYHIPPIYST